MTEDHKKVRDINAEALASIYGDTEEADKQFEDEIKHFAAIIENTFTSDWGEQCLRWLEDSFEKQLSFDPDSARQTDFNEGCRHVVLTIKSFLNQN